MKARTKYSSTITYIRGGGGAWAAGTRRLKIGDPCDADRPARDARLTRLVRFLRLCARSSSM